MDTVEGSTVKGHPTFKSSEISAECSLSNGNKVEQNMIDRKKSHSLPFLPHDETNYPYYACQTLPPKISAVKPFTEDLFQGKSVTIWHDTTESFHSSEDLHSENSSSERVQDNLIPRLIPNQNALRKDERSPESSCINDKMNDNESKQDSRVDLQTINTETRTFVRSSALDILAAFPNSETVSSHDKQPAQPVIEENPDDQTESEEVKKKDLYSRTYSYKKATKKDHRPQPVIPSWSSTTETENLKKKAKDQKKNKDYEKSFSSISQESSNSSKERLAIDRRKMGKKKKNRARPKSSGLMNLFRGKSESKEDSYGTKEEMKKPKKPVQKSESFHSVSTPKNNQLNRMDSFRKLFRRPKDPAARDSVFIDDKKQSENVVLEISAPIVKPNFQPANLVDREVIIAQRNRAYQLDKEKHKKSLKKDDGAEDVITVVSGETEVESNSLEDSCYDNQPVPPVRWKHLEKKRLSRATEDDKVDGRDGELQVKESDENIESCNVFRVSNEDETSENEHGVKQNNFIEDAIELSASGEVLENNNDAVIVPKYTTEQINDNDCIITCENSSLASSSGGRSSLCLSPSVVSKESEETFTEVFEDDTKVSFDSDQTVKKEENMPSEKLCLNKPGKWQSVGSSDVSKTAIHHAVKKTYSLPGGKSPMVSTSPELKMKNGEKQPQGRHMSIFGRLPSSFRLELSEAPTMVTDLVPTAFPTMPTDRRSQIVLELFTTERTYVRGLETMIELFKRPMLSNMEEKDIDELFSNINDIFSVNKDLLFLLWEKLKHWRSDTCIAQLFIDLEERLKIYAIYCKNFDNADSAFKQRLKKNKEFERFLKSCYQDPLCQPGLDLPAYLITVVQRIPRYLLLLKDLRNKTPPSHPDYDTLNQSLIRMHKVAEYINSQLQEVHSKKAMQELRSTVIGLKAYEVKGRTLLKEAEVCLMSPKKPYKCLLFNDIMVFAVQGTRDRSEIEMTLELRTLWFEDLKKYDPQSNKCDAIELFTPHRPYTMYTCTRTEKRIWLQKLRIAIVNLLYGPDYEDADVVDISRRKASDTYIDGSVYCGEYLNGKRHGHGVMAWPNRTRYEGSWVDDERHGHGDFTYYTGEKYVGSWVAGKKDGHGVQTFVNGDVYTGMWSAGKMNGKGVINFSNGDRFVGDMVNNEVEGEGELTCVTGLVYKGGWKKSKRHGHGHLFLPNKNEYIGELFNDRICGNGKMIYFNGDEFNGEWLNEMRHGLGIFKLVQGNVYDGQWTNDFRNGQGKMTYPNRDEYTGTWHQNKRVGKGQMMYANGHTYNGQWEDDTMNGKGVMYYKDGSVYDGYWERGQPQGYGTVVYRDKSSYEGEFQNGLRHGRGKLIYSNNVCYVGEWKADKFGGNGVFSDPNTEYSYQGDWICGMREGNGVEISYKTRYEGGWKSDMRHGPGIEKSHEGHFFEGSWKENKKHGRGIRTLRSKVREEQQWHEGHLVNMGETVAEDLPLLPRR